MVLLAVWEAGSMVRGGRWGGLWAFGVLWFVAAVYGTLVILDVQVPRPPEIITAFFEGLASRLSR